MVIIMVLLNDRFWPVPKSTMAGNYHLLCTWPINDFNWKEPSELFCLCCVAALKSLPALSFNALIFPILRIVCTISFHSTSFVDLLCFCSVLCLLCFVRVCLYVLCGHLLGKGWPLGSRLWCLLWVCHFPIGILGQVWYLIVSIPDLCTITYFS